MGRNHVPSGVVKMRYAAPILIVLLFAAIAGCDWVTASGPETVRLRLEGEAETVDLIVSKRFLVSSTSGGVWQVSTVLDADTTRITLPYERTYDVSDEQRFFARVPHLREGYDLRMRGWIDGEHRFDGRSRPIPADSMLQFVYVYGTNRSPDDGGRL